MKLPPDSIIATSKLTRSLLVPQAKGDKSNFLATAGYDLDGVDRLMDDLRTHVLTGDAQPLQTTEHGQYYALRGDLTGPNGRTLHVRTIWMKEHLSQHTKFITLIPERKPAP